MLVNVERTIDLTIKEVLTMNDLSEFVYNASGAVSVNPYNQDLIVVLLSAILIIELLQLITMFRRRP